MPTITLHRVLLAITFLAIALLADAWRVAHHDVAQLAATLASQNAAIRQSSDQERQRDAQLAAALAAINAQKKKVQTPQQSAAAIPVLLQNLPFPISIHIPDLAPTAEPGDEDNSPATISVPQPDLKPLYDEIQDCRSATLQNAADQKDLADEKLRSAALAKERDAALNAARGGSFWARLKHEAKWFAIGLAAGAAATAVARR
jgi:hypothetical protein